MSVVSYDPEKAATVRGDLEGGLDDVVVGSKPDSQVLIGEPARSIVEPVLARYEDDVADRLGDHKLVGDIVVRLMVALDRNLKEADSGHSYNLDRYY